MPLGANMTRLLAASPSGGLGARSPLSGVFAGSVENQYFVGSLSSFGHSIRSHSSGMGFGSPVIAMRRTHAQGVNARRQFLSLMAWPTHEDVTFRYLSADTHSDHGATPAFRKRHAGALAGLVVKAFR